MINVTTFPPVEIMSFITHYMTFDFPTLAYQKSIGFCCHLFSTYPSSVFHASRFMYELIYLMFLGGKRPSLASSLDEVTLIHHVVESDCTVTI